MKKTLALCGAAVAGFALGVLATFIRDNVIIVEVEKSADDEDEKSCEESDELSFDDESLFEDESTSAESDATDDSPSEEASI